MALRALHADAIDGGARPDEPAARVPAPGGDPHRQPARARSADLRAAGRRRRRLGRARHRRRPGRRPRRRAGPDRAVPDRPDGCRAATSPRARYQATDGQGYLYAVSTLRGPNTTGPRAIALFQPDVSGAEALRDLTRTLPVVVLARARGRRPDRLAPEPLGRPVRSAGSRTRRPTSRSSDPGPLPLEGPTEVRELTDRFNAHGGRAGRDARPRGPAAGRPAPRPADAADGHRRVRDGAGRRNGGRRRRDERRPRRSARRRPGSSDSSPSSRPSSGCAAASAGLRPERARRRGAAPRRRSPGSARRRRRPGVELGAIAADRPRPADAGLRRRPAGDRADPRQPRRQRARRRPARRPRLARGAAGRGRRAGRRARRRARASPTTARASRPGEVERAFQRFYRGDPSRSAPGTGLGLAIVRELARAHGGDAVAENVAPHGARLSVVLPETPSPPAA